MHEIYQSCIEACNSCAMECEHCAAACLQEENKSLLRCIQLCRDCAGICLIASQNMARGSEFASRICALCAEICQTCADECSKHQEMDHCKRCAKICLRCVEECRRMAKVASDEVQDQNLLGKRIDMGTIHIQTTANQQSLEERDSL